MRADPTHETSAGPLAGLRVVELCGAWARPLLGKLLVGSLFAASFAEFTCDELLERAIATSATRRSISRVKEVTERDLPRPDLDAGAAPVLRFDFTPS